MTDLTPYYWAVIYRSPAHPDGPLISLPMREPSAEAASDRALGSRQISDVLNVAGPFGTPAETEAYRLAWMREQRAEISAFLASDLTADEEIETGPGFPVACSSVHEHDPEACGPEAPVTDATTATETASRGIVWAVTAETFGEMDADADTESPETFVRVDDITTLVTVHRAAGASVEVSWPFGSDGTGIPTYVHVYVDSRGVVTYRRANPGESDL